MDIYEAVENRRAVRAFTDEPVPRATLERVMKAATRAPSGGNIQPWNIFVLTGAPLDELKRRVAARVAAGDRGDPCEFEMYPPVLRSPYRERRAAAAAQRFSSLGVARDDKEGHDRAVARNWNCFGAPAALFCYVDRGMGSPQWADLGMFLQTVMLVARAENLDSCPQLAWSVYRTSVAEIVHPRDELMLFCGMSIGYADPTERFAHIDRAPLAETVTFVD